MNNKQLSRTWLYVFIGVAAGALITCIAGLYYKEYLIAGATGMVFGAQVVNIIQWKKKKTTN